MRFLMTYRERRAEPDPAAAQRRAARLLAEGAVPGVTVHALLGCIGGGGYAILEAADAEGLGEVAILFSAFACTVEPVVDLVSDAASRTGAPVPPPARTVLPEMPAAEPHEGAFSDDDVYDWED